MKCSLTMNLIYLTLNYSKHYCFVAFQNKCQYLTLIKCSYSNESLPLFSYITLAILVEAIF